MLYYNKFPFPPFVLLWFNWRIVEVVNFTDLSTGSSTFRQNCDGTRGEETLPRDARCIAQNDN